MIVFFRAVKPLNFFVEQIFALQDLRPISIVENDRGFRALIHDAYGGHGYKMPVRSTFTKRLESRYEDTVASVIAEFKDADFVAATTDGWKSDHSGYDYTTITAHYVKDGVVVSRALQTLPCDFVHHTGPNLAKELRECFEKFGILDKLVALAKLPNVAIKATGAPHYSTKGYPFRNIQDGLRRIFESALEAASNRSRELADELGQP